MNNFTPAHLSNYARNSRGDVLDGAPLFRETWTKPINSAAFPDDHTLSRHSQFLREMNSWSYCCARQCFCEGKDYPWTLQGYFSVNDLENKVVFEEPYTFIKSGYNNEHTTERSLRYFIYSTTPLTDMRLSLFSAHPQPFPCWKMRLILMLAFIGQQIHSLLQLVESCMASFCASYLDVFFLYYISSCHSILILGRILLHAHKKTLLVIVAESRCRAQTSCIKARIKGSKGYCRDTRMALFSPSQWNV